MRSDARSNRLRILEAATEALALPGDTSLKSIARRAGVGQGTLYRHFPTREALILEVHEEKVAELVAAAPALLASLSPPLALRTWLGRLLSLGRCVPEFADAMIASAGAQGEPCRQAHQPLLDALSELVGANERAGTVVPGTTADDVLLLIGPLWRAGASTGTDTDTDTHADTRTDATDDARSARLFDVLMGGMCPTRSA